MTMEPTTSRSTNELEGCHGCLVPIVLVLLLPGVLVWIGNWLIHSLVLQAVLLAIAVAAITTGATLLARSQQAGARVAAVFCFWCAAVLTFATLYAAIYISQPAAFRVNRDVLDEATRASVDKRTREAAVLLANQYFVMAIESTADQVHAAVSSKPQQFFVPRGIGTAVSREVQLTPTISFHYEDIFVSSTVGQQGMETAAERDVQFVIKANGQERWRVALDVVGPPQPTSEKRLLKGLVQSKTPQQVTQACRSYRAEAKAELQRIDRDVWRLLTDGSALEISEFVLFSASISGTVGPTDLAPNNRAIRYLVVLQAFVTVFIFGYAIQALRSS